MAASVRPGQVVHMMAEGRAITGRVARMNPNVDPVSRAVTLYVEVPNASGALKSGAFATGRVVNRLLSGVTAVPLRALRQSPQGGSFVYRIADNRLEVAPVQVGITDQRRGIAELLDGLADGDRVVVGNVGTLGNGMAVTVLGDEGRRGGREGRQN
jgi:membrane fusion protein (multidrug efflux system)